MAVQEKQELDCHWIIQQNMCCQKRQEKNYCYHTPSAQKYFSKSCKETDKRIKLIYAKGLIKTNGTSNV